MRAHLAFLTCVALLAAADKAPDGAAPKAKPAGTLHQKLARRTDIEADRVPLEKLMADLSKEHGITIRLDEAALERAGVSVDARVTLSAKNVQLRVGLARVLRRLKLGMTIDAEAQEIV